MPTFELISGKTCPFAHRTAITLAEKNIPFSTTYINLMDKPDWFNTLSPLGKIPLLRVDKQVLFESTIINEYLDETHPPSLQPTDPLQRAHHRAWIVVGGEMIMHQVLMMRSPSEVEFLPHFQAWQDKICRLEAEVKQVPFFAGTTFSLLDAAFAPLFIRARELAKHCTLPLLGDNVPRVQAWAKKLCQHASVTKTLPNDYSEVFLETAQQRGTDFNRAWLNPA